MRFEQGQQEKIILVIWPLAGQKRSDGPYFALVAKITCILGNSSLLEFLSCPREILRRGATWGPCVTAQIFGWFVWVILWSRFVYGFSWHSSGFKSVSWRQAISMHCKPVRNHMAMDHLCLDEPLRATGDRIDFFPFFPQSEFKECRIKVAIIL